ncbi:hypothetical protein B2M26_13145 [Ferroacidibacillus organovorans]|uniref:Uncharacterized protein n=1 Tax=Ferroacidibacillus organovorans TaxID=1765683 RepID=A0A1V4EQR2_9BACL|nr:hypothetical protein B2M26_13145 [Ferroacidibacillus organovorans]
MPQTRRGQEGHLPQLFWHGQGLMRLCAEHPPDADLRRSSHSASREVAVRHSVFPVASKQKKGLGS